MCSQTLSSPAIAWLAKPQAEERRGWEADSASKPAPIASDNHSSDSVSKRSPGLASRLTSATDNEAPSRHQPLSDPSSTPVAGYRSAKSHRGSPTHPHQMALGLHRLSSLPPAAQAPAPSPEARLGRSFSDCLHSHPRSAARPRRKHAIHAGPCLSNAGLVPTQLCRPSGAVSSRRAFK